METSWYGIQITIFCILNFYVSYFFLCILSWIVHSIHMISVLWFINLLSNSSHLFLLGCKKSTFECYFQKISGCSITSADVKNAVNLTDTKYIHELPYSEEKFLYLNKYPTSQGICRMCGDEWGGDSAFFDGLHYGKIILFPSFSSLHFSRILMINFRWIVFQWNSIYWIKLN